MKCIFCLEETSGITKCSSCKQDVPICFECYKANNADLLQKKLRERRDYRFGCTCYLGNER